MGFWSSLLTGSPDPLTSAAIGGPALTKFDAIGDDLPDDVAAAFGWPTTTDAWLNPPAKVSRKTAISVPAVKAVRDTIVLSVSALPVDYFGPDKSERRSSLFTQPEAGRTREATFASTLEDLLFEGRAYWRVTTRGFDRYPAQVEYVPAALVQVMESGTCSRPDCSGRVQMRGKHVHDGDVIGFESPSDPLLVAGARAIRTALALDAAAALYANEPAPLQYLAPVEGVDPTDEQIQSTLDGHRRARQKRATGYLGAAFKLEGTSFNAEQIQLADGRNHAALEIARLVGMDPMDLGVAVSGTTLNYQNDQQRRLARRERVLQPYANAITSRLSLGDVTPYGSTVRFNWSAYLRLDDRSRMETYEIARRVGALTLPEIRGLEDRVPLTAAEVAEIPGQTREPVAA